MRRDRKASGAFTHPSSGDIEQSVHPPEAFLIKYRKDVAPNIVDIVLNIANRLAAPLC